MECWNCQAETHGAPFCPACGKIGARAPGATWFDVFGLTPTVDVDAAALDAKFRELSLKLHPDRFATADARERRLSLEQTSALNTAYQTLKDPAKRVAYLLSLHGVDLDADQGEGRVTMAPEFLMEIMELREALDGARQRRDLDAALRMAEEVKRRKAAALDEAMAALRTLLSNPDAGEAKRTAAQALGQSRYFARFLQEVEAMEEEALA
ncbi:MAG: Fe-S protein assembly co-chaperone HscB [Myxococcaceae bacterium]|nr:Fe-S protein assembly co-chaperone HscB [Myxococcaceae bacterium]